LSAESTRKSAPTSLLAGALCFGRVFCDTATGYQECSRSSLLCFDNCCCVATTGLLKTFKAGGKIDGAVFPINA